MLEARRFVIVGIWSRGVDTEVFHPARKDRGQLPRPIWINVGRVSVAKNIEKFLSLLASRFDGVVSADLPLQGSCL